MYALNLSSDNRILSATYPEFAPEDAIIVDSLPDGDITDYLYINGKYIYAPLPAPEPEVISPRNIVAGEYVTIDGVLYKATTNIPNGEPIIVGQNAVVTTVEEQLYELKGD